jgi:hypothetical protein
MKDFKNKLLGLIDNGASQAKSLIESFNDVVDSFDMNAQIEYFNEKKKELIKRGNELFGDFAELLKQVKESLTDFSVTVPFDESIGEKISYEVKDGKLEIEVSYADESQTRSNKTSVVIPTNCDLEQVSFTSNSTLKTATVTIPKKVIEPIKEEAAPTEKPKKKTVRKKAAKKAAEEATPSNDEETMTHISSKLAQKLNQNGSKYAKILNRGANGRFVRRTPKSE